jgi:hypothetical protein
MLYYSTSLNQYTCLHAYLPVFLLYVCLYAMCYIRMPAANSIISISLYVYSLMQSFTWACYMPALYANKFYIYPYINLYTCYNAIVSMSVNISSLVSTYMPSALFHMLYARCYE